MNHTTSVIAMANEYKCQYCGKFLPDKGARPPMLVA
jgi:hypothetical protein